MDCPSYAAEINRTEFSHTLKGQENFNNFRHFCSRNKTRPSTKCLLYAAIMRSFLLWPEGRGRIAGVWGSIVFLEYVGRILLAILILDIEFMRLGHAFGTCV